MKKYLLALLLATTTAHPALAARTLVQSSAAVATGALKVAGIAVPLGPVVSATGNSALGAYSLLTNVPEISQSIYGQNAKSPGLVVSATNINATAAGTGTGTVTATAAVSIDAATISLVPPLATGGSPYLSVALQNAGGTSTYIPGGSANGTAYGASSFGSLVISGTLLANPITAPLNAAPNTVLFQNSQITVTINAVLAVSPVGCGSKCGTLPQGIETAAALVTLNGLVIDGKTISGTFAVGETISQ